MAAKLQSRSCEVDGGGKVALHHVGHFGERPPWRSAQRILPQPDDLPSGKRPLNEKSCLGDLYQLVKWDGRRFPGANRFDGQLELPAVAFVLYAFELLDFPVARQFECAEIVEPRNPALAEH